MEVSKTLLALGILSPFIMVAEYFVVLHAIPFSPFVTTDNAIFYALVGTVITLLSLHLATRTCKKAKTID